MSSHRPFLLPALIVFVAACDSSATLPYVSVDAGVPTADAPAGNPDAGPQPATTRFSGATAVKAQPAGDGWMVLLETLQTQLIVTIPNRRIVMLNAALEAVATHDPIAGWTLIDAAAHPSGDVSAVYVHVDYQDPHPLRVQLSRYRPDGSRVDTEVAPVDPPAGDISLLFMASLDRARVVASGEELYLAARWAGNAVYAYHFGFDGHGYEGKWSSRIEPEAEVSILGIIGGGFDNFHQGDNKVFVYLDVDGAGNVYVAVPSDENVLQRHDAAFGEQLLADADPDHFDFRAAILTKIDAEGRRVYARLLGAPGRPSLLNMRAGNDAVLLVGRFKTGSGPDSWDAWILSAQADTGAVGFERTVDVDRGDMFWDAVALPGERLIAVGSTGYTQNPSGLSVSDERDALAVVLDSGGRVVERLDLPHGTEARGNEAVAVHIARGLLVIAGMLDGPGTHAEVRSSGFLDLRALNLLSPTM